jgi:hypothetical protein
MLSTLNASMLNAAEIADVSGGYVDWETDWCGTRIPGWPRPKTSMNLLDSVDYVALNPQPLPPVSGGDFGMTFSF